jgi:hypothetical protein
MSRRADPRAYRCRAAGCGCFAPEPIPCCLVCWYTIPRDLRRRLREEFVPTYTNEDQPSPHWLGLLARLRALPLR